MMCSPYIMFNTPHNISFTATFYTIFDLQLAVRPTAFYSDRRIQAQHTIIHSSGAEMPLRLGLCMRLPPAFRTLDSDFTLRSCPCDKRTA